MKLALFLAATLVLGFATVIATPVASACPDADNPCDPLPVCTGGAVSCAKTILSCLTNGRC